MVYFNIYLLLGLGCLVCVILESYIDVVIDLFNYLNVILSIFGDMMKVNGSRENLIK